MLCAILYGSDYIHFQVSRMLKDTILHNLIYVVDIYYVHFNRLTIQAENW